VARIREPTTIAKGRLVSNLIDNALHYNHPGGNVGGLDIQVTFPAATREPEHLRST
jgi:hypothetical protein